jgi:trigger factor
LDDQKLDIIGSPDLKEEPLARGQAFKFAVTVETAPDFELPDYKGLPAKREDQKVTDADVE